jgi:hypothetical protein
MEIHMASAKYKKVSKRTLGKIEALLNCIDPNINFKRFAEIFDLVYFEGRGSMAALKVLDAWARKGGDELITGELLRDWWISFEDDDERYFGMGKLMSLAKQSNASRK